MSEKVLGVAAEAAPIAPVHTPGPWFVGTMNDALFILDEKPRPAPVDYVNPNAMPNARVIAKMGDNDRRADADASLIAAAPELLAALKMARTHVKFFCDETDDEGTPECLQDLAQIDAAIAKAEQSSASRGKATGDIA